MNTKSKSDEMEVDDAVSICRLCAEMTSSKSFMPLFTDDKQEQPVTKQINQLIVNLISPNDGLPQEVCLHCAENVSKYYAFVSNIIETQNKLRRIVQLPEIKRMGSVTDNPTEFLNNHEESGNALMPKGNASQKSMSCERVERWLNENNTISLKNENAAIGREKPDGTVKNIPDDIEIVSEKTVRTLVTGPDPYLHRVAPRPTAEDRCDSVRPPLYRCSICFEKFKIKEECLRHIVHIHPQVKKPVSSDTIFESVPTKLDTSPPQRAGVRKPAPAKGAQSAPNGTKNNVGRVTMPADRIAKPADRTTKPADRTTKPADPTVKAAERTGKLPDRTTKATNETTGSASNEEMASKKEADPVTSQPQGRTAATENAGATTTPNKPTGRRRKILDIDSFYRECRKQISRYICDVCGRAMASKFAFQRHLLEHDPDEDSVEDKRPEIVRPKPPRKEVGHCKFCKKTVQYLSRHKMYHAICKLESDYPDIVKMFINS